MFLFHNIKPRRYNHRMMYSDERRERLRAIEERARRELGLLPPESPGAERLRGVFTGRAGRERRGEGRVVRGLTGNAVLVGVLLLLFLLLRYLVSG